VPLDELVAGPGALLFAFLLGALLGSFANVCILRIPAGESIVHPPSRCGSCGAGVRWFDNLPIVSWLALRGRCRACGAAFSARYLLVEAACGLLFAATFHLAVNVLAPADELPLRLARFAVYALFVWTLLVITFIDLDHMIVPDRITYPGIPIFFALGLLLGDVDWADRLVGAAGGYLFVRLLSDGYYWITKREGLGVGDGKLLALVGALLGWQAVVFALFGGALIGTFIAVPVLLALRGWRGIRRTPIPFGPFLAAAAVVHLFLQDVLAVSVGPWW
jgi:leader peptidase (prepilin peptidase)/N-methyltransferase